MGKLIFDYKDGDLIHIMSEQTAIDMDAALALLYSFQVPNLASIRAPCAPFRLRCAFSLQK